MAFIKWSIGLFCIGLSAAVIDPNSRPTVSTTKGDVIGWFIPSKATSGTYMRVFRGIPYARPPIKDLKFKDPLPANSWATAKNLSQSDPESCAQITLDSSSGLPGVVGSEDCLFINVYTPQDANTTSLLPVMVWIYGGGFITGASTYSLFGPDLLVNENVIFVSLNYRLGVLGFLNLGTDAVPGNAGLKDQLLALQWVQTEIVNFGGDPTKVTLFGESAGAASVSLLYLSPKSDGLFRNAIAESGTGFTEWTFQETGITERAETFSLLLNCATTNTTLQLSCLQNATVADLLLKQLFTFSNVSDLLTLGLNFIPSLEKPTASALLSDTPDNLLAKRVSAANNRPVITGINKDEGIFRLISANPNYYNLIYNRLEDFIQDKYRKTQSNETIQSKVALIKAEYFNNTAPTLSNLEGMIKIFTDTLFGFSTAQFARSLASSAKIYLYSFEFNGDYKATSAIARQLNLTNGVSHTDELGYLFLRSSLNQSDTSGTSPSGKTLKRMVKMWTNFATHDNPTPDGISGDVLGNILWSPIADGAYRYLRVTDELNMSTDNFKEECFNFWNKIEGRSFGRRTSCSLSLIAAVIVIKYLL